MTIIASMKSFVPVPLRPPLRKCLQFLCCFGPNFDPDNEWDRAFIDRVHALDVEQIENGGIKPTHMMAVMTKKAAERTIAHKHLTPEFCIRWP